MLKKKVCTALWQAMQDPNCEELYEVGLSLGRLSFCGRTLGKRGSGFFLLQGDRESTFTLDFTYCQGHH